MKNRVTVRDIAKAAGVSPSAVTMALNGRKGIGQDTRARILQVAQSMGYVRSQGVRVQPQGSQNIHYVIPRYLLDVDRASVPIYHDLLMQSVEKYCRQRGCFMVVHYIGEQKEENEAILRYITSAEEDTMVICQSADTSNEMALQWKRGVRKVVFLNKQFDELQVDCVASDGVGAVYSATAYLLSKGYRQIGHLKGKTYFKNLADREAGYLRCLQDHQLESAGTWIVHTSYEQAYQDVWKYLSEGTRFPRALICDGDRQAMGAIRALKEFGMRVPQEIAVMGYDDLPMSAQHEPPLSTCSISWEEMARLAVNRVIEKTGEDEEHNLKILVGAVLMPRATT